MAALSPLLKLLRLSLVCHILTTGQLSQHLCMANIPSRAWPSKYNSVYSCQLVPDSSAAYNDSSTLTVTQKSHRACVNTHTHSLGAFSYLCTIHKERVNDPVSPLPAAHCLHAAVVLSEREMRLCAVVHKLPLKGQTRQTCKLRSWTE